MRRAGAAAAMVAAACAPGRAAAALPLAYLSGAGEKAHLTVPLTWAVLTLACAVTLVITLLTVLGIRRRVNRDPGALALPPHHDEATRPIYLGLLVSGVLLLASLVWTVVVLHQISGPQKPAALTIQVTAQQWWWKATYLDPDPSKIVTTANEIHIPTGQRVHLKLVSADVIHSFWVPALGGKTDLIPGQVNETWIEADVPGRYRGQCSEYCGAQHAHMAFAVVAQEPQEFRKWLAAQLEPAAVPTAQLALAGAHTFEFRCGACHTVRGTAAGGVTGPDLTHLMSRQTIAALTVPNSAGALAGWINDPQAFKPGNRMPTLQLSAGEIRDIDAFLVTLK